MVPSSTCPITGLQDLLISLLKARNRFRKAPGTSDAPTGVKGRRDFRL